VLSLIVVIIVVIALSLFVISLNVVVSSRRYSNLLAAHAEDALKKKQKK